jgi:hypothetical protein
MVLGVATREWDGWKNCVMSWLATASDFYAGYNVKGKDVLPAFQEIYEKTKEPIIAYIHDDVVIHEKNWDLRVLREFEDPSVGLVGFGGAKRHGSPDLYKTPYRPQQLGRFGFMSNMRNAEAHGARFTGECTVAVLDGFAVIVRREILDKWGGWPQGTACGYFCYDYAICCEARRQGYSIRLVGVDCDHLSGKTASLVQLKDDHAAAHQWLYDNYQDVLPYEVEEEVSWITRS